MDSISDNPFDLPEEGQTTINPSLDILPEMPVFQAPSLPGSMVLEAPQEFMHIDKQDMLDNVPPSDNPTQP